MITKDDTLLLRGRGDQKKIDGRVNQIRRQIEDTNSEYEKEKMQERMARYLHTMSAVCYICQLFVYISGCLLE